MADYDNECENTSTKKKLLSIMDNDEFQAYLQDKSSFTSFWLLNFICSMGTKFDAMILTEIGARNLSVVLNLFPNYTFYYMRPHNNNYGGVGIYTHYSLLNIVMMDDLV